MLRSMSDLPNVVDFRFIGVYDDGNQCPCTVKENAVGCHGVYRDSDNESCFMHLVGWKIMNSEYATTGTQAEPITMQIPVRLRCEVEELFILERDVDMPTAPCVGWELKAGSKGTMDYLTVESV